MILFYLILMSPILLTYIILTFMLDFFKFIFRIHKIPILRYLVKIRYMFRNKNIVLNISISMFAGSVVASFVTSGFALSFYILAALISLKLIIDYNYSIIKG